jgi:hypothetical protein
MLDIHEEYGIIEPLKRGEVAGLLELLESDREISRRGRDVIIALLKKNPPKRPKGRPGEEDVSPFKLLKICQLFSKYHESKKMPVDDSLEKMAPELAMSVGTIKGLIYSPAGKAFLKAITPKP